LPSRAGMRGTEDDGVEVRLPRAAMRTRGERDPKPSLDETKKKKKEDEVKPPPRPVTPNIPPQKGPKPEEDRQAQLAREKQAKLDAERKDAERRARLAQQKRQAARDERVVSAAAEEIKESLDRVYVGSSREEAVVTLIGTVHRKNLWGKLKTAFRSKYD